MSKKRSKTLFFSRCKRILLVSTSMTRNVIWSVWRNSINRKQKMLSHELTYRLSSSWLLAKACANRSKRIERAVNGEAPPPELDSPPDTDKPWSSSRLMSADICASCNWGKKNKMLIIWVLRRPQTSIWFMQKINLMSRVMSNMIIQWTALLARK